MDMNLRKLGEIAEDRGGCHTAVRGVKKGGPDLATQNKCFRLNTFSNARYIYLLRKENTSTNFPKVFWD